MFSFPEACRSGDKLPLGWGILGNSLFFFPNVLLIAFNGASVSGSRGGWGVEGVALGSYVVIAGEEG
jgi:hypothetical protein